MPRTNMWSDGYLAPVYWARDSPTAPVVLSLPVQVLELMKEVKEEEEEEQEEEEEEFLEMVIV